MQSLALYHSTIGCCCRELQQLHVASAAGTTSSAAPDAQQAQHAGQLAAAQQACAEAKADSASLQNTVHHLQSGLQHHSYLCLLSLVSCVCLCNAAELRALFSRTSLSE